MLLLRRCALAGLVLSCSTFALAARADAPDAAERTLSPYFAVDGGDPALDRLPLERTQVRFEISGVIADVTVRQTYKNAGGRPLSARYVFPASIHAAVHGMRMAVGAQVIEARIAEREHAQAVFATAKREGKTASLLDQERPNVFSMQVANVMPGDRIEVELRYTETLVPTDGTYEFVYPAVVGPRYPSAGASASETWIAQPYLPEREAPTHAFELAGRIATGVPIQELSVPSHRCNHARNAPELAEVALDPSERAGGDRDFILRYRLAGERIESGLLLYKDRDDGYFLLTVQPPRRVAKEAMPSREYVFVLDVSGSMHGFPLDTAKLVLRGLAAGLRPQDSFNVLLFSGGSTVLWPRSQPATPAHVAQAMQLIDGEEGGGATELLPALQHALSLPSANGTARTFVVVTDGYISAERDVFDWIRGHLGAANVFSFGIGTGVNRYLIDGIARAGLGEPFVVTDPTEARATAERFHRYIAAPALTDIAVAAEDFAAFDLEPSAVPDLFAERPLVISGRWRGGATGRIRIHGRSGTGAYEHVVEIAAVRPDPANAALARLWARTRIAELSDFAFGQETDAERAAVTELGLRYNLLTKFTSFVAVAPAVRNPSGGSDDVDQPLPLPLGVSELAVGDPMYGAPEPELGTVLFAVGLLLLALAYGRTRAARPRGAR